MPANCTTDVAREPNQNPPLKRTWNSCSATCPVRVGHTGNGGFDGDETVAVKPSSPPWRPFCKGVYVLFTRAEEIQKVHTHVFAGLADAQEDQILFHALFS